MGTFEENGTIFTFSKAFFNESPQIFNPGDEIQFDIFLDKVEELNIN